MIVRRPKYSSGYMKYFMFEANKKAKLKVPDDNDNNYDDIEADMMNMSDEDLANTDASDLEADIEPNVDDTDGGDDSPDLSTDDPSGDSGDDVSTNVDDDTGGGDLDASDPSDNEGDTQPNMGDDGGDDSGAEPNTDEDGGDLATDDPNGGGDDSGGDVNDDVEPNVDGDTEGGDDSGGDANSDDSGGDGDDKGGPDNTVDNQLKYAVYRNMLTLRENLTSYQDRLSKTSFYNMETQSVSRIVCDKLHNISEALFEFMVYKFKDSTYVGVATFYNKAMAATSLAIDLLYNNKSKPTK